MNTFDRGRFEDGLPYLKKLSDPNFKKITPDFINADTHSFWSAYYNHTKQYKKAEEEALIVINLLKDKDYIVELTNAYDHLSVSLAGQGRHTEAYNERLVYEKFNEEALALQETDKIQASIAKFKTEQYLNEIETQKEKAALQAQIAENKNHINTILIVVCVIILILFLALLAAFIKRRSLNIALQEKNQEYLNAKKKSDQLAKAKSKFFSTVSHELRTPLYGVIGLSSILLDDPDLKKHEKDLKSLKFSADYLLALINDVLQINKIDSENLDNDESEFNISDFISSIAATFEYMRLQNKNEIKISIDPKIPKHLKGNVVRLSQILMNLVGNALKFTENGVVSISLFFEEAISNQSCLIRFSIADTGIGIPKNKQPTIFDEFTQVESLDYRYQGTGLGLPIVKKLLAASNSEVDLQSEMGKGTTMAFSLDFEIVNEQLDKKPAPVLDQSLLIGKRILVADDNRINQMVTKKILEKKQVICTIAENGVQALELIKDNNYDLVLMDLNMPRMDGFQATKAIRKFNTDIPIIALTAVEVEEVRNQIMSAGMNDIIVKPYDDTKFALKILKNLDSKI